MKTVKATKLIKMYADNGFAQIQIKSEGEEFKLNIDSGEAITALPLLESKPQTLELKIREIEYCSEEGEKYKMYVLATEAWKEDGGEGGGV